MKAKLGTLMALGLSVLLLAPLNSIGKGGGRGGGNTSNTTDEGSGGGGGSSEHGSGGNTNPGEVKGDLYGDLYIIVRDANGEPLYFFWDGLVPAEGGEQVQPIALDEDQWIAEEKQGEWDLPASCEWNGLWLVPMNEEGEVAEGYEEYTQEVELGRLNIARAPEQVLEAGYEEAINSINSASSVESDACGRLTLISAEGVKTIDSPRENLALYKTLMKEGYLPGITLSDGAMGGLKFLKTNNFRGKTLSDVALDQAASFLSGAGDKGTVITVDEIVYLNTTLGINETTYFDFMEYDYDRAGYDGVWVELMNGPINLILVDAVPVDDTIYDAYYVANTEIQRVVFGYTTCVVEEGIAAFFASVNDALQVLTFVHDREPPEVAEAVIE